MTRMMYGTDELLEDVTNEILKRSLAGVYSHKQKADILTPWKDKDRHRREVYTKEGHPERHLRQGIFNRVANKSRPDLNSRDGLMAQETRHRVNWSGWDAGETMRLSGRLSGSPITLEEYKGRISE